METTTDTRDTAYVTATPPTTATPSTTRGRWIEHWDPEDPGFWDSTGRRVARRNLAWSIFAEFLGFCVWALWSVVVPLLPAAGFDLSLNQQFWLIALPSLVGATVRIPYTFAVPAFGGRTWTVISALLLVLPASALAWVVTRPDTPFAVLLACAALAGFGGGNFASSMTNISFFFPEAEKGKALGLNAAGGNLGTGVVQMVVPAIIAIGAGVHLERAGLVFIPLALLAAFGAWRWMDNLSGVKSDYRSFAIAARNPHTWIISFLYIGTFGSFIGYAGAFPTLLRTQFPSAPLGLAFLGALIGALTRPLGGMVADRLGGARVTIGSFALLVVGALGAVQALRSQSFGLFFASFLVLFTGAGLGNGATYRMIPAVFRAGVPAESLPVARKAAAGCIGIAGAVGAYGGFLIPRGFAMAQGTYGSLVPALLVFIAAYVVMGAATYAVYAGRRSAFASRSI
ncbi:NNP family nitrate/nitrite transporter-like MFS transporter [Knoellia remsis]|uniref:NNP family nitrate/nitrite transporter-like MFS transporter n=1 Tax=Knoellia remsis TaxID=407159 RepID=A0A2T0UZB0_9MICO|nr:MFS transporter [Knoellia remsis]PRY63197.1 NNP family nitrate/nitrite transporter-like MFS transporter [Knoellia remsis]